MFGAKPRDFDAILPCPRDNSNNIGRFGASNLKCFSETLIPTLSKSPQGPRSPKGEGGGGLEFEQFPGYSFICVWPPVGGEEKQGSGRGPEILMPYCHAQGAAATTLRCFGASNFKRLLRNPIAHLILTSGSPTGPSCSQG